MVSLTVTIMNRHYHAGCCHSWVLSCRIGPPNRTVDSRLWNCGCHVGMLSCPLLSCRDVVMKGQYHPGMLSCRSRDVAMESCCHAGLLSWGDAIMQAATVIHGCYHAGLHHLTEPKVSGQQIYGRGKCWSHCSIQAPIYSIYCSNTASKASVACPPLLITFVKILCC
jgi:hypothetical protein